MANLDSGQLNVAAHAWQARGPGFESPMLHRNLNSELALDLAECQVFGLDHNFRAVDHNCDQLLETTCHRGSHAGVPPRHPVTLGVVSVARRKSRR